MKYWIIVASKDHLQRGLAGGFIQANHGKAAPLKRMRAGDWIIFYSPKLEYDRPEKLQCFTAIGRISDENIYQADMGDDFVPFRRDVKFLPAQDVSILPLIDQLTFIKDKTQWGATFRFGTVEIPESDFRLIAEKMVKDQNLFDQKLVELPPPSEPPPPS
jgi:predicted RNA-binding protein